MSSLAEAEAEEEGDKVLLTVVLVVSAALKGKRNPSHLMAILLGTLLAI